MIHHEHVASDVPADLLLLRSDESRLAVDPSQRRRLVRRSLSYASAVQSREAFLVKKGRLPILAKYHEEPGLEDVWVLRYDSSCPVCHAAKAWCGFPHHKVDVANSGLTSFEARVKKNRQKNGASMEKHLDQVARDRRARKFNMNRVKRRMQQDSQ